MKERFLEKTPTRNMTIGYMFVLVLLAVLSITAYLVLQDNIMAQETNAVVINVAGRQRMLSQRIAFFSLHLVSSNDPAEREEFRQELLDAISLMGQSHDGLVNGDPNMNLPGNPSLQMGTMYFKEPMFLDSQVRKYLLEAKALADTPDAELTHDNPSLLYVLTAAPDQLLKTLDATVKQYEIEAEEDNAKLQELEGLVLGSTLFVLLIVALFIFRPMVLRIQLDITEQKKATEELKRYSGKLEQSNRLKDIFTDIMTHDLLNPAGIINNSTELSLDKEKNPDKRKLLQITSTASKTIISMIENASILAKLESGEELALEEQDLGDILRNVATQMTGLADEKKMKIKITAEREFKAPVNPLIYDLFSNLIGNAIKYGPENSSVVVEIEEDDTNWKISVADSGPGIPDEYKEGIFDRFTRIQKHGVKGTGLGLAIAKRVVESHKGQVWVEDNPDGGSIFYVKLPKEGI